MSRPRNEALYAKLQSLTAKGLTASEIAAQIGRSDSKTRGLLTYYKLSITRVQNQQVCADVSEAELCRRVHELYGGRYPVTTRKATPEELQEFAHIKPMQARKYRTLNDYMLISLYEAV